MYILLSRKFIDSKLIMEINVINVNNHISTNDGLGLLLRTIIPSMTVYTSIFSTTDTCCGAAFVRKFLIYLKWIHKAPFGTRNTVKFFLSICVCRVHHPNAAIS